VPQPSGTHRTLAFVVNQSRACGRDQRPVSHEEQKQSMMTS
jgi:hypothetical protein